MRGSCASVILWKCKTEIYRLERFMDETLHDCRSGLVNKVKIILPELFDNFVEHARGVFPPLIFIRLCCGTALTIELFYVSSNFSQFVTTLEARQTATKTQLRHRALRYSDLSDRYRGLGLVMCTSLGAEINVSTGIIKKITVRLKDQENKSDT